MFQPSIADSVESVPAHRRRAGRVAAFFALALTGAAPTALLAHEGHDHDEAAPAAAMAAGGAARNVAELNSELFEALVESHGDHLDIWLDRYDTNEPVPGAKLALTLGDGAELQAAEESPGQYTVDITPIEPGSAVAVTLTVQVGDETDLLGGTLEIAPEAGEGSVASLGGWIAARWHWALGLVLLVLAVLVALRLRRVRAGSAAGAAASVAPVLCGALAATVLLAAAMPAQAHEGHDHEEEGSTAVPIATQGDRPMRLPDGSVFVPKATQRIIAIRTQIAMAGPSTRCRCGWRARSSAIRARVRSCRPCRVGASSAAPRSGRRWARACAAARCCCG
jgi:cobalt-zinc-cadmium efflux system membrane fusion protein